MVGWFKKKLAVVFMSNIVLILDFHLRISDKLWDSKIYFILVFLLICGLLSFWSASRPLYWHSGCFPVTNLKIKHGKDIVWFISFSHTHLNWQFVKRNGKCHGACPVLPFTSSSSFPPKTHIYSSLSVTLPQGPVGKAFQSSGYCRAVFQRKESESHTLSVSSSKALCSLTLPAAS